MEAIKFNNYGVRDIEWLIREFNGKPATKETVTKLKDEIWDAFINNPFYDFSTKGNISCIIVDLRTLENCEILYN
mgnify:FL=1